MAQVIWTEPALADLNEIAEYISLDNFQAAQNLVQKVFSATDLLDSSPRMGRRPPELPQTSYKEIIVAPCRILYRIHESVDLIAFWFDVEINGKFYRRHIVDIPRIKFFI